MRVFTIRLGALYLSAMRRTRWVSDRTLARPFHTEVYAASILIALAQDERRDEHEFVIEPYYPPQQQEDQP